MSTSEKRLFILGGAGFIGKQTAWAALKAGWRVILVARNPENVRSLADAGARILKGDAHRPQDWMSAASGCCVLIDLIQPKLPKRIGLKQIQDAAHERLSITRNLLRALATLPAPLRPRLFSVSGLDDLAPGPGGLATEDSALRTELAGFAHIGIPVRKLIESSNVDASFIYLATVYGPGKSFADSIFPRLAAGKLRIPGDGQFRMPLVHVEDVARALVHLAALPSEQLANRTIVIADGHTASMREFLGHAAMLMSAPAPRTAPLWLARLFAGSVLLETMTRNIAAEPATLRRTGFVFRYTSFREGLPPTLRQLGYGLGSAPRTPHRKTALLLTFILSIAAILSVNTFVFPGSAPDMMRYSKGLPLLDMRFHYTVREVYQLLDALGPAGRGIYLRFYWTLDLVMPALFGAFLWLAIRRTALRKFKGLAVMAACADYAENISITVLLCCYPWQVATLAAFGAWLTTVKWLAYAGAMLVAAIGAFYPLRTNPSLQ